MSVLAIAVYAAAGLTAALALYYVARGFAADLVLLGVTALLALTWALEGAAMALRDLSGIAHPDPFTLYGYLLTGLVMPIGALYIGATERSRYGSVGILVVGLTELVLQLRLTQIWEAGLS